MAEKLLKGGRKSSIRKLIFRSQPENSSAKILSMITFGSKSPHQITLVLACGLSKRLVLKVEIILIFISEGRKGGSTSHLWKVFDDLI